VHKQFIGSTTPPTGEVGVVKWQVAKVWLGRHIQHIHWVKDKKWKGKEIKWNESFHSRPGIGVNSS
jgi:hypothetical protein